MANLAGWCMRIAKKMALFHQDGFINPLSIVAILLQVDTVDYLSTYPF